LFLIVITCVLNQSNGHWLLSDALNFTITTSLKLKEEVGINLALDSTMDDDPNVALELFLFASKMKEVCGVLDFFLSF
jgi:hypothetical protein